MKTIKEQIQDIQTALAELTVKVTNDIPHILDSLEKRISLLQSLIIVILVGVLLQIGAAVILNLLLHH